MARAKRMVKLSCCVRFITKRLEQILNHKRAISALILVASFARSKISSQFLGVNGILKFTLRYKFIKGRQGDLNYEVAPFPLNDPPNPDDVRSGMRKRFAPHAVKNSGKF